MPKKMKNPARKIKKDTGKTKKKNRKIVTKY